MSDSSYINEGNFRYGITEYDQPCIPQYNSTLYHKKHALRDFPNNSIKDDGMPYRETILSPSCCNGCNKCNKIVRNSLMTNLVNIQTSINKVLTITLYGVTKDLDKTVKMIVGNKYCVSYVTEHGIKTVTGRLGEISNGIPDDCIKYIGNFSSVTTAAYIGLDCSTDGSSDKRLIYIASIRYIEQVFDKDEDQYPDLSPDEKLNTMLNKITSSITTIEEYIAANNKSDEEDADKESSESDTNNSTCVKPPRPPKPPYPNGRPGPYQGPLIVGQMHPYPAAGYGPGRPGIFIDNHECHCDHHNIESDNDTNNNVLSEDLINNMKDIMNLLTSYITEYNNSLRSDICDDCDLGVPIVEDVPYDALSKDLYIVEDENKNT